jgi:hypothetical protein
MRIKIFILGIWIVLLNFSLVFAKQELMLSKEQLFDSGPAIDEDYRCDSATLYYVDSGEDIADMRRDFPYYFCQGMYTLTLDGPPGTTVTLFGSFSYNQERGYLVLRKKDDQKIWLLELEEFQADQWSTIETNSKSGAYEAYYHPAPNFRRNISSVKWGPWWPGAVPGNAETK